MKENELEVLARSPLFAGKSVPEIRSLLSGVGSDEAFSAQSPVKTGERPRLGIVLSGAVAVYGEGTTLLNRISPGGLFGVARLFGSGEGAATRLVAVRDTVVFFLTEEEVEDLTGDPFVRKNLYAFLCDRIRFLNRKVATFSAPDARTKVALYLLERENTGTVELSCGLSEWARVLDLGRASLYRALGDLERSGAIRRQGKIIEILSRETLEEI